MSKVHIIQKELLAVQEIINRVNPPPKPPQPTYEEKKARSKSPSPVRSLSIVDERPINGVKEDSKIE